MKKTLNRKTMQMIRESQEFGIDDRLSRILERDGELSEEDLSLVSAAANPDYLRFRSMMDNQKK